MKTNAVRLLESLGVQYELREYDVDPDDLAAEPLQPRSDCRRSRSLKRCWRAAIAMAFALP